MSVLLLQLYLLFCFLILLYTVSYIIYQQYYKKYESVSIERYMKMIVDQNQKVQEEGFLHKEHVAWLSKQLKKTNQLVFFEKALTQLDTKAYQNHAYLKHLEPVVIELAEYHQRSNQMTQAYLAYFIAKCSKGQWEASDIYRNLLSYLNEPTIYLRENVLLAMCQQKNPQWILKVLQFLTRQNLYHQPKLIQDGLLTFPFNSEELTDILWDRHQTFQESIVLGLIGFITIKSPNYKEVFFKKLVQKETTLEVKLQIMRYFKKHHYSKVEQELISLISDKQFAIRIVAASALGSYSSEVVVAALKKALTDSNWYVRKNASLSLLAITPTHEDILEVLNGSDRYAKEMLSYHLGVERR
ncbi:HEAT repeat domain-containing protein (plasmid) [Planococcus maritimus]|uniref:HEAT repeat domain-containing protein n=1 Tax=Planococcus maritimus TaxID=192421 RepID=A0A7D7MIW1_PLAMR|nr:HEAT repeat domain-containing protein [Planococcus maritimus]QMT19151.1 HEAT repeat domain-containing protein [Planococcus maritimus]